MSDFAASWALSRQRFLDAISDLNLKQLNWRLHPGTLTLGEAALHVAGVEVSFASQLLGLELSEDEARIKAAATDGVVNDKPFPYAPSQITPSAIQEALAKSKEILEPLITAPSDELRSKQIVSALGPVIDGNGAFARLGFHAGYHQGQAHLIRTAPGFPVP
jgi:hypothetical protein